MLSQTLKFAALAVFCAMILAQVAVKPSNGTNDAKDAAPMQVAAPASRVEALAATPVYAPVSALDEYRIPANAQGHYVTDVFVNGQALKMVVDTGATMVALRNEDAAALGVFPLPSDFTIPINTANGIAHAAPVKLRDVQLGSMQIYDVDAIVAERGVLNISLLGMTFLSRLSKVEMASGSLLLRR
ncbi:MAG TPA: TIGR02281 family clan AA aspartic protease [Methylocystis sp.]